MQPSEIDFMIQLLYKRSGLVLAPDQQYLLESRLAPIIREQGFADMAALVAGLRAQPPEALVVAVTEAMTTNETSFFRDGKPFEHLRQIILPQLRHHAGNRRRLRIWSAACSGGQEPYSLAMMLLESAAENPGWEYEILATDLAGKMLEKARQGIYSQFEAQRGMPIQMLLKYFQQLPDKTWQVKEPLQRMITFRAHNLLDEIPKQLPWQECYDLILCRNVLIYFDEDTKKNVVNRLSDVLQPGGFLCIGSTESILDNGALTQPEGLRGIYQLAETAKPLHNALKRNG